MKKQLPIQLAIPHPCTQKWDEMTVNETGRFCAHCQKTVIDFTTWSDAALYNFFANNTGEVCGRIFAAQLRRPINIPPQPHSRLYRLAVALGLTLIFGEAQQTLAQAPLKTEQNPVLKGGHTSNTGYAEMRGRILNDEKEPILNATVQVYSKDIQVSSVITDYDGNFVVKPLNAGYYDVLIIAPGYNQNKVVNVIIQNGSSTNIHITLERPKNSKYETVITAYRKPLIDVENNSSFITGAMEIGTLPDNNIYDQKKGNDNTLQTSDSLQLKNEKEFPDLKKGNKRKR